MRSHPWGQSGDWVAIACGIYVSKGLSVTFYAVQVLGCKDDVIQLVSFIIDGLQGGEGIYASFASRSPWSL